MTTERQRKLNRERQQRFRDRKKQNAQDKLDALNRAALEAAHAKRINEEGLRKRTMTGECSLGEISPGVDAATVEDALQVAREMARALDEPDVQPGESLIQFERRVWYAWIGAGGPFLIRDKDLINKGYAPDGMYGGRFYKLAPNLRPGWGRDYFLSFGGFDKSWLPLPGSDAAIDVSSLPALPSVLS